MAEGYDGSIKIDTLITTKRATSQLLSLENRITKTADKIAGLKDKMRAMEDAKIPTDDYRELQKLVNEDTVALNRLQERMEKFISIGGKTDSKAFKSMQYDMETLKNSIKNAKVEMKGLEFSGDAFINPKNTEEYAKMQHQLKEYEANLAVLVLRHEELNAKIKEADLSATQKGLKKAVSLFERFKTTGNGAMKNVGKAAASFFAKIHRGSKSSENVIDGLGKRIWSLAKQIFVFSLIGKGFRAMTSGMQEGLQNFARYSDEYNKEMSELKSSTGTLKNAMATAFAPILTYAIPALTQLVDWLTAASNATAQFFAILSGKSTWTKATKQQTDYAKSLDKTAGSAKKAAGALASFDTLEVLNKKDSSGGAGGVSPKDMFEEVPVDEGFKLDPYQLGKDFSNWLADGLENIDWEDIKRKAEETGRNIARFLNGVWENERLAADMGATIGEALNTGVAFAYGFIDENKWQQMGRFLGTIVQSGIDTFDEEKAGETAGKLVNGLSDAVIGYFQTYKAGSLGAEIASFLNRAVWEIDADKFGAAASSLVGGFFAEIGRFFDDVDAVEVGSKVSQAFIKFFTYAENDGTVGERAGHALASAINAGVDLLLGANAGGMTYALSSFIIEVVSTAFKQISWWKLLSELIMLPLDALVGINGAIVVEVAKMIGATEEQIAELENATSNGALHFIDCINGVSSTLGNLSNYLELTASGMTYNVEQLKALQEQYAFTDDDIDSIIQSMIDMDEQLNLASLGLDGYAGSWSEFSANTVDIISKIKEENQGMVDSVVENGTTLKTELGSASEYISTKNAEMAASTSSARELIGQEHIKINDSLAATDEKAAQTAEKVSELSENAASSLSGVNSQYSETLDNMTAMTDEWFSGMSQYFSAEQWQQFSDNITGTMLGCLDTMTLDWTTILDEWMIQNNELYFGYDIWYAQFENILLAYQDVNGEFQSEWQTNTDTWWNTMVLPFFEIAQWQLFGANMKTGIMQGFKVIVSEMGGLLNKIITMFNTAFKELEEAMNDLIDSYNASASALGTSTLSRVHYKPMGGVKIPALASGAVIRGGSPFLAILGDQPRGQVNVETPLNTMVDAFQQALDSRGAQMGGSMTVNLVVNGERWAQATFDDFVAEANRRGGIDIDLIGGTT